MAAPKGNEYYLIRSTNGKPKKYKPSELIKVANEYFNWCLDNPLISVEPMKLKVNGKGEHVEMVRVPKMRVFSIQGFCNYAEISEKTFWSYSNIDKKEGELSDTDEDYLQVTTRIRSIIEGQQFEGASSGLLNANIIARKLGLADKTENKSEVDFKGQITGMEIK